MDQGKDICKRYNMFFSSTIKICTCTLKTKSTLNKKGAPWTFSLIKTAYHKYCTGVAYVYSKTKLKWENVQYLKEKPNKWNLFKKGWCKQHYLYGFLLFKWKYMKKGRAFGINIIDIIIKIDRNFKLIHLY